ncbi:hypothetical protein A9G05_23880 [Pseudomonas sp. ENNP23]|nr:hypothetical protein A9G05_23880 [Pseudomonas sp. ENNP23]
MSLYATLGPGAPWLPRSLNEAEGTARQTLGPLLEQERAQGAPLLHSLQVFLEENRSWQATARRLHIHKQTLVYRMRRIEAITGRSLDSTEDVTVLWLALRAARFAGIGLP